MELTLITRRKTDKYTIGMLTQGTKVICDTLEDPVRELKDLNRDGDFDDTGEGKIYGKTAIPEGRYKVIVNNSRRLKRRLPILLRVPGFEGIRIHGGRNETWSSGCILVGANERKGELVDYAYYESIVVNLIDEATRKMESTYITINR